jgi:hypothetical protein
MAYPSNLVVAALKHCSSLLLQVIQTQPTHMEAYHKYDKISYRKTSISSALIAA